MGAQTQKSGGAKGWRPEGWGPEGGEPKISRFFFPSPASTFVFFSLSLALRLSCEAPAACRPLGFPRRSRAAQSRVERGQCPGPDSLAPKTADTLRELQEKRPVAQGMEIPPAVLEYTPERPLDLDADLFGQGPPQDQEGAQTRC